MKMKGLEHLVLVEMAEKLWQKHGKRYRTLIPEYHELIAKKRELKISPLNRVKQSTLNELPDIEFLNITNKKELRSRIKKLSAEKLTAQIIATELMLDSYAFRTIESHIFDYKYEISHLHQKKGGAGSIDTEYCRNCSINTRHSHAENG